MQQVIIAEEFDKRPDLIKPSLGIAEWILPTILDSGTDVQRERFARPILRGTQRWCQLFSEPGAGSDLASLSYPRHARSTAAGWSTATRSGPRWPNRAQFGALLARTDPDAPKHRGISYFLVDMTSPGIEVAPIKQASGRAEFNEVFFTDVFVPDDMLVGKPGGGWGLAVSTMAVERTAIGNYVTIDRAAALRHIAEVEGPDQDAALRALGDVEAYTTAIKAMVLRETLRLVEGQARGTDLEHRQVRDGQRCYAAPRRRRSGLTGRIAMLQDSDPAVVPALLRHAMPSSSAGARQRSS